MEELTIEEKAKRYDEAIERAEKWRNATNVDKIPTFANRVIDEIFPEFKESEDDRIRKALTDYFRWNSDGQLLNEFSNREVRAWLEKQGTPAKLSEEEQNRFAKGVLTSCAMSFINYLDAHKYEGKMCVSNGECEDIENAFHNAIWDKLHRYYCKYIEKQGEKKPNPYSGTSFECNGHTWGMCARDNGVEILLDGELKAFLSLEKSFIYPIHPQPELAPKSAMEAAKEEKVDNKNCVKPANKIEPKFHEGEWITSDNDYTWKVTAIETLDYVLQSQDGNIVDCTISYADKHFHLWTIQDAKLGDVLATPNCILIFEKLLFKNGGVSYCHYDFGISTPCFDFNKDDNWYFGKEAEVYPATKEQHDLLFQKMNEAGYKWDFDKKELNKIDNKPILDVEIPFCAKDSELVEASYYIPKGFYAEIDGDKVHIKKGEQKPVWSEDDEEMFKYAIGHFEIQKRNSIEGGLRKTSMQEFIDWIKSLKDRLV